MSLIEDDRPGFHDDLQVVLLFGYDVVYVPHAGVFQPFCQVARDVAGAVLAEQAWFVCYTNPIAA